MERCDRLTGTGWRLWYDDSLFSPGTDSFLLSALPVLKPGLRVCDLGCGSGLLGLLLLRRQPSLQVTGIDCSQAALTLGARNAAENGLGDRLRFLPGDLRYPGTLPAPGSFDLAVANPPYFPVGSGAAAPEAGRRAARTEETCSLEEVCRGAARLLRWGGSFCLVHRPDRLADLLAALRESGLEAKRLRPVLPAPGRPPSLLLAEGRRGGKPGLVWEPALCLQTAEGAPSPELRAIYGENGGDTR